MKCKKHYNCTKFAVKECGCNCGCKCKNSCGCGCGGGCSCGSGSNQGNGGQQVVRNCDRFEKGAHKKEREANRRFAQSDEMQECALLLEAEAREYEKQAQRLWDESNKVWKSFDHENSAGIKDLREANAFLKAQVECLEERLEEEEEVFPPFVPVQPICPCQPKPKCNCGCSCGCK